MCSPGLSPCAWASKSRSAYPAACKNRARPTISRRLERTECASTTAPPPVWPLAIQHEIALPDSLANEHGSRPASAGGAPTSRGAAADSADPSAQTNPAPASSAAAPAKSSSLRTAPVLGRDELHPIAERDLGRAERSGVDADRLVRVAHDGAHDRWILGQIGEAVRDHHAARARDRALELER